LSGAFYSDGRAEEAATAEDLNARLANGPAWVAVRKRHRERVPEHLLDSMQPVFRGGEYDLYYANAQAHHALAPFPTAQ